MVATGTIEDQKRNAARRVTDRFLASPVDSPASGACRASTLQQRGRRQWVLECGARSGPVLQALAALPIHDLSVEPFSSKTTSRGFYGRGRERMTAVACCGR